MLDLILKALDDTLAKLDRIAPTTKTYTKSMDIMGVNPLEIHTFMKDNNIPDNAYFDGIDNSYDDWVAGEINLSWDVEIPTTKDDILNFKRKKFTNTAVKFIFDSLTNNGYGRVGFCSSLLDEFRNTSVYVMYMNKDYDKLVKYYSLYYKIK